MKEQLVRGEDNKVDMVMGRYVTAENLTELLVEVGVYMTEAQDKCRSCVDTECNHAMSIAKGEGGLVAVAMMVDSLGFHDDIRDMGIDLIEVLNHVHEDEDDEDDSDG